WPPRVTLGRLLPHARGLGFKPGRGSFPSGAKKEWNLSPKAKVRVLHTAHLDVTRIWSSKYGVFLEIVFALDQGIIYGISDEVDTTYSSKSGNGFEFI
nr:hypothetical protein [Tanacetum cinerariifolium]